MYSLLEDNTSIENSIKYLDSLIVKLRNRSNINNKNKQYLLSLYNDVIIPWVDKYYITGVETSKDEEQEMMNIILDNISIISKFLNKEK
jgi:hypothetical protein